MQNICAYNIQYHFFFAYLQYVISAITLLFVDRQLLAL